jgi:hypothetical protein
MTDPHPLVVASAVGVPALTVLVMTLLEGYAEPKEWRYGISKLGWDLCVLAVGLVGGIFTNPEIVDTFRSRSTIGLVEAICFLSCLATAIVIMHLRRGEDVNGRRAVLALVFGGVALAIPTYIAATF